MNYAQEQMAAVERRMLVIYMYVIGRGNTSKTEDDLLKRAVA